MMSALECHMKADSCEEMARKCADPVDRSMLLHTAGIWRKLAATPIHYRSEIGAAEPA
jgi:hypothetical protein